MCVTEGEKAKETKWLSSCLLKGAEIRHRLQSSSQDGLDLNGINNPDFSQALERIEDVRW